MRVAVLGAAGQLGSEVLRVLAATPQLVSIGWDRRACDMTSETEVAAAFDDAKPDVVINCVAYNLVDQAEDEPETAFAVNAFGPRTVAIACETRGATLLHVSTDHVFGADRRSPVPWTTDDPPLPLGVYANSKLAGEHFVRTLCPRHFVVRTCGLYGHQASRAKGNFVETMLRLGRERPQLNVVDDQICTPTAAADLAEMLVDLACTDSYGLYHGTNSGSASWYQFAREIFRIAAVTVDLQPIPSSKYPTRARRPAYSVLDLTKLSDVLGRKPRPWQEALADYLCERS